MSAKGLFTFKHFKFHLLPLLTHSALLHCIGLSFWLHFGWYWVDIFISQGHINKVSTTSCQWQICSHILDSLCTWVRQKDPLIVMPPLRVREKNLWTLVMMCSVVAGLSVFFAESAQMHSWSLVPVLMKTKQEGRLFTALHYWPRVSLCILAIVTQKLNWKLLRWNHC